MFKILSLIFTLLRMLAFDNKDEFDITSTKFNTKKAFLYCLLIFSLSVNLFLIYRGFQLAEKTLKVKVERVLPLQIANEELITKLNACEKLVAFNAYKNNLEKNNSNSPLDVRNQQKKDKE